jgi:hypothetical protein
MTKQFEDAVRDYFEPKQHFEFISRDEQSEVFVKSRSYVCSDVVRDFYHFMLGAGFSDKPIVDAFQAIIEEVECLTKD